MGDKPLTELSLTELSLTELIAITKERPNNRADWEMYNAANTEINRRYQRWLDRCNINRFRNGNEAYKRFLEENGVENG